MKIYTKTGDGGQTSLLTGARVDKSDARIDAYGTVDELNCHLGAARAAWPESPIDALLASIQNDLFTLGASLAAAGDSRFPTVSTDRVRSLEEAIDTMESELPALANFILPGGSMAAAQLHVCRAVCRRAERLAVAIGEAGESIEYLNRLSDYLFVAARYANHRLAVADVIWRG